MSALTLNYDKVKYYYDNGLWNITRVRNAVIMEVITPEQFTTITEQVY